MKLIIACDPTGGIGYKNKLPWDKLEGDLPRFKELTNGKVVVMGRKTWDSLPVKPLPNRLNYIYTSDPYSLPFVYNYKNGINHEKNVTCIFGFNDLKTLKYFNENACIIGGADLINKTWDRIHEIHLSRTKSHYACDKFIDLVYLENNFGLVESTEYTDHYYEIWTRQI